MISISSEGTVGPVAGFTHLAQTSICQRGQFVLGDFISRKYLRQQNIQYGSGKLNSGTGHAQYGDIPEISDQRHIAGLGGNTVANDVSTQLPDGSGSQIIRIYTHATGENQKIRAVFQMLFCGVHNLFQFVLTDGATRS